MFELWPLLPAWQVRMDDGMPRDFFNIESNETEQLRCSFSLSDRIGRTWQLLLRMSEQTTPAGSRFLQCPSALAPKVDGVVEMIRGEPTLKTQVLVSKRPVNWSACDNAHANITRALTLGAAGLHDESSQQQLPAYPLCAHPQCWHLHSLSRSKNGVNTGHMVNDIVLSSQGSETGGSASQPLPNH